MNTNNNIPQENKKLYTHEVSLSLTQTVVFFFQLSHVELKYCTEYWSSIQSNFVMLLFCIICKFKLSDTRDHFVQYLSVCPSVTLYFKTLLHTFGMVFNKVLKFLKWISYNKIFLHQCPCDLDLNVWLTFLKIEHRQEIPITEIEFILHIVLDVWPTFLKTECWILLLNQ